MSVGLTLVPSSFADTNELIALAESLGRHGRLYVQHARWWAGWHARASRPTNGRAAHTAVRVGRATRPTRSARSYRQNWTARALARRTCRMPPAGALAPPAAASQQPVPAAARRRRP